MQQLLQAKGWFGLFLRQHDTVSNRREGAVAKNIDVVVRPMIGWCSAEGGFRGLYYNESRGSLSTAVQIKNDLNHDLLGDVCSEKGYTRTVLRLLVRSNLLAHIESLEKSNYDVVLTTEAEFVLQNGWLQIPKAKKG